MCSDIRVRFFKTKKKFRQIFLKENTDVNRIVITTRGKNDGQEGDEINQGFKKYI